MSYRNLTKKWLTEKSDYDTGIPELDEDSCNISLRVAINRLDGNLRNLQQRETWDDVRQCPCSSNGVSNRCGGNRKTCTKYKNNNRKSNSCDMNIRTTKRHNIVTKGVSSKDNCPDTVGICRESSNSLDTAFVVEENSFVRQTVKSECCRIPLNSACEATVHQQRLECIKQERRRSGRFSMRSLSFRQDAYSKFDDIVSNTAKMYNFQFCGDIFITGGYKTTNGRNVGYDRTHRWHMVKHAHARGQEIRQATHCMPSELR